MHHADKMRCNVEGILPWLQLVISSEAPPDLAG